MRLVFGVELVVGQDEQEKKNMCTKCFAVALGAVVLAVAAQGLEENDTLVAIREDKSLFSKFRNVFRYMQRTKNMIVHKCRLMTIASD